ncbi:MAG: zinc-dependent alcohol dehydrogenase family protein [Chlamydiia bacterium]|nr:zinc-dependent alcohol dehydrogenase family protein [Chlamydiia bacterium]
MKAMVLEKIKTPLVMKEVDKPAPKADEVLIRVKACGVCRTDLHLVDGELEEYKLPIIPGHQVVGVIEEVGDKVLKWKVGDRVGVPWLGGTCGTCEFCRKGQENLCDEIVFTGATRNGGYAEYVTAKEGYILPIPDRYNDVDAAPLLCAGLIGYRTLRKAGDAKKIGFYGFGSAAHLLIQAAVKEGKEIYVFTRPGDGEGQAFAKSLGATWAGGSDTLPPEKLDAALIFAPVGSLYLEALKAVKKGVQVISAGIHMSDIPSFPYSLLWGERAMTSVANLTRDDGKAFMELANKHPIHAKTTVYPLEKANEALHAIRDGSLEGSLVLQVS